MVVCMDSKMFLDHFIYEQSPKTVLDAAYIVASNKIRYGKKYSDQVELLFLPNSRTIMAMDDENSIKASSNSEYVKRYYKELEDDIREIALIIKMSLLTNSLAIILTTSREAKAYGHIKLFRKFVKDKFDFDIPMYKPGMDISTHYPGKTKMIEKCESIIKEDKKREKKTLMKSEKGQREYYSRIGKKGLKKILKKEGLYVSGMDEAEMIDTILTFIV